MTVVTHIVSDCQKACLSLSSPVYPCCYISKPFQKSWKMYIHKEFENSVVFSLLNPRMLQNLKSLYCFYTVDFFRKAWVSMLWGMKPQTDFWSSMAIARLTEKIIWFWWQNIEGEADIFSTQYELCHTRKSCEIKINHLSIHIWSERSQSLCYIQSAIIQSFVSVIFLFFMNYLLALSPRVELQLCLFVPPFWYMRH